jgi:DNA-binding MarR family transcriptional regulator
LLIAAVIAPGSTTSEIAKLTGYKASSVETLLVRMRRANLVDSFREGADEFDDADAPQPHLWQATDKGELLFAQIFEHDAALRRLEKKRMR